MKYNFINKIPKIFIKFFYLLTISVILIFIERVIVYANSWDNIVSKAKGQEVYWNAWGGSAEINDYIQWVSKRVKKDFGVIIKHVKLSNTADAVTRILLEKTAGRTTNGSVDLIWINGENFSNMKKNGLLFGPFTEELPNFKLVDFKGKPTTLIDFNIPVDGYEAPWGMAKFNFVFDSARVKVIPKSIPELLNWSISNPGRFTYPHISDFLGSTFLMQILIELTDDPNILNYPVKNISIFKRVTEPLWNYLEKLHPYLWRSGKSFPLSNSVQLQMLNNSEIDIALSFNPSDTSSAIANGKLPKTSRTFVFKKGTIGNTHFVAIPFNSGSLEGAMVVSNFLIGPEAQIKKQNPEIWGDSTVLSIDKLSQKYQRKFKDLPLGIATLPPNKLGATQRNPHPEWKNLIDSEWKIRFSK